MIPQDQQDGRETMATGKHEGPLGAVYEAKRPEEVAALYDGWAETYDAEMSAAGYRHPTICLALLSRHLPRGATPLLDAGAGTGLIGEWLGIMGYPHVEALDISEGMLAQAAKKGAYTALHRLAFGGSLPFADGHFAGIVSAGVFTSGHVGVEGLRRADPHLPAGRDHRAHGQEHAVGVRLFRADR